MLDRSRLAEGFRTWPGRQARGPHPLRQRGRCPRPDRGPGVLVVWAFGRMCRGARRRHREDRRPVPSRPSRHQTPGSTTPSGRGIEVAARRGDSAGCCRQGHRVDTRTAGWTGAPFARRGSGRRARPDPVRAVAETAAHGGRASEAGSIQTGSCRELASERRERRPDTPARKSEVWAGGRWRPIASVPCCRFQVSRNPMDPDCSSRT